MTTSKEMIAEFSARTRGGLGSAPSVRSVFGPDYEPGVALAQQRARALRRACDRAERVTVHAASG